jgi:hypothetical protein
MLSAILGRVIARAVSRRRLNAAVRVPSQVRGDDMGFGVENVALGRGFLQVLRSFIPILIQPTILYVR